MSIRLWQLSTLGKPPAARHFSTQRAASVETFCELASPGVLKQLARADHWRMLEAEIVLRFFDVVWALQSLTAGAVQALVTISFIPEGELNVKNISRMAKSTTRRIVEDFEFHKKRFSDFLFYYVIFQVGSGKICHASISITSIELFGKCDDKNYDARPQREYQRA